VTINGATLGINNAFSSSRSIVVGSNGATINASGLGDNGVQTFSGVISGNGNLVIAANGSVSSAGDNSMILSGNNTYTGTTTITSGVVRASTDAAFGNASNTLVLDGGGLYVANDSSTTINRAIQLGSGGGTFRMAEYYQTFQTNYGFLDLLQLFPEVSVSGTYQSGVLTVNGAISGSGNLSIVEGGVVNLNASNSFTGETAFNNSGSAEGTILNLGNVNALRNSTLNINSGDNATVNFTAAGTNTYNLGALKGSGNLNNSGDTLSVGGNGQSTTYSGSLSGAGGLIKTGAGTMTLSGNNSYSGGTVINGGVLQIGNGANSGAISGNITNNALLVFNRAGSNSFGGVISGSGSLTQAGTGTLTLSSANSYTGTTRIAAGKLNIGNVNALAGSTLDLNGNDYGTIGFGAGSSALYNLGGLSGVRNLSFGSNSLAIGGNGQSTTYSGSLSGSGSVTKSGEGTLTLIGNNSYGDTTISAGTLQVGNGGAYGTLGSGNILNNGVLAFNRSGTATVSNSISGTGSLSQNGGGTILISGNNTYTGGTMINAGTLLTSSNERLADTGAVTVNTGAAFKLGGNETIGSLNGAGSADLGSKNLTLSSGGFSGVISGSGDIYKTGTGVFTLSGNSSGFTGDLYLQGGSVVAGSSTALNANNFVLLSAESTFTANQDLVLGGIDQNGGIIDGSGVITSISTITRSGEFNAVLADVTGYNSGVLKLGGGTTTLGAANTYTGTTKVSEGTLALGGGGSLASNSSAQINSGATLDLAAKNQSLKDVKANGTITGTGTMTVTGTLSGSGTVAADTVVNGTHSPGNSPGIQSFGGNLTYQPGATMLWQLADNTTSNSPLAYDQVIAGGNLTFNGGTTLQLSFNDVGSLVNWTDALWTTDQSWTIYQVSGLTSGLENLSIASYASLLDANGNEFGTSLTGGSFSIAQNGQNVVLNYNAAPPAEAIPEPSTYALFGLGALALVIAYRRKSQQAGS
jgi:autotransporter-associated beta strand protein